MRKTMDKEHSELQKRDSLHAGKQLKLSTRTKRTRREGNISYADNENFQRDSGDMIDTGLGVTTSHSFELEMASANKYLDTLLTKITKKLLAIDVHGDSINGFCGEGGPKDTQMTVDIVFNTNRSRKLVFRKKDSESNVPHKRRVNRDGFESFVTEKMDKVRINFIKAVYVYYSDFVDDVDRIVNDIFFRFKIPYNAEFFKAYYKYITEGIETYKQRKLEDINVLYEHFPELRLNVEKFPRYPLQTRKYYTIDNYVSALEKNPEENVNGIYNLENLLKSEVKPNCNSKCCCNQKLSNFCKISQFRDHWETGCLDKKGNIECDDNCGCQSNCKNRALQKNNMDELTKNVDVKLCWGLDLATRQSICFMMPAYLNFEGQRHFMDKILNTLNEFGYEGWNITNCLQSLVTRTSKELKEYLSNYKKHIPVENKNSNNDFEIILTNETSNSTCNSHTNKNVIDGINDIVNQVTRAIHIDQNEENNIFERIDHAERISNAFVREDSQTFKSLIESQISNPYVNHIKNMPKLEQLEQELEVYTVLLKYSKISQARATLRVHSKGLGVVCNKPSGIEKNSLVVRYIGEVYPVWYWCMKQDVIKSFFAMVKKDKFKKLSQYKHNYNIDFYNIMLEKNSKESRGKDIVVVDPIIKGNFASRLSHSCDPNCMAFPVISNGQYSIAMYAIRDIGYQEELTFDYCSITESEQEYKNSVCLCGTLHCKGHYLGFTKKHLEFFTGNSKKFLIDDASNSFLRSNANILQACETQFTESKRVDLIKYCIGDNTFKDAPEWLKNWSYYVVQTIKKEKACLIKEFLGIEIGDDESDIKPDVVLSEKETNSKFEIDSLFSQRMNNLVISIDKLRHFMNRQAPEARSEKPLKVLNLDQHINYLVDILETLMTLNEIETSNSLRRIIKDYIKGDTPSGHLIVDGFNQYVDNPKFLRLLRGKMILLETSSKIRPRRLGHGGKDSKDSVGCRSDSLKALCDILYLMAFNVIVFTSNSYEGFSIPIDVRECDLTSVKRTFTLNTKSEEEQLADLIKPITTLDK